MKLKNILSKIFRILFFIFMALLPVFLFIIPVTVAAFIQNPEPICQFSGKLFILCFFFGVIAGIAHLLIELPPFEEE